MKEIARFTPLMTIGLISVSILSAQGLGERDTVPLKNWDAPMYWQPSMVESKDAAAKQLLAGNAGGDRASSITSQAQTPANSLVFVGMTPCRVVDTRTGSGFTGFFGPPSLAGGVFRIFPIQSSTTCSIPSIAQAYSFNITVVPNGFLDFITVWPTGQPQPNASTLNGYVGTVIANAAVVPAGTSGQVNVYASQNTNLIIDINGYYAAQSGITLAQGTAGAPSLSFAGDPGTGLFSSAAGTLNMATGGTTRLSLASNGDLSLAGNLNASSGNTAATEFVLENTTSTAPRMYLTKYGSVGAGDYWPGLNTANTSSLWDSNLFVLRSSGGLAFSGSATAEHMRIGPGGHVGIGTTPSAAKFHVEGGSGVGVYGNGGYGVYGFSSNENGAGVYGVSSNAFSFGVRGVNTTSNGIAGYFDGRVFATGTITQNSDARLKQEVAGLGYGLREVLRLHPVTWNWKDRPDNGRQLGLIAQEVETVLPELVTTEKDAEHTKGLNYIGLVPVTIKAIQEQQAQIEEQEKRNAQQQERITEQAEQLEAQRRQIDGLKLLICLDHPQAAVCR